MPSNLKSKSNKHWYKCSLSNEIIYQVNKIHCFETSMETKRIVGVQNIEVPN